MSDSSVQQRRQPPSPLVFSPDAILSPSPLQAQQSFAASVSNVAASANTVSMPFVRRHVTRRLRAAKAECDKELHRITNNITAFFEERLREGDQDLDRRDDDQTTDYLYHPQLSEFGTILADDYSSEGGYDADPEFSRHSRQGASTSAQMSPVSLRRQGTSPWDRPVSSSVSSSVVGGSSPASSTILLPEQSLSCRLSNAAAAAAAPATSTAPGAWTSASASSRRLSRAVHMAARPSRSGQSSRSTSRSRSPLPPLSLSSFSEYAVASALNNRRTSRVLIDDPVDPLMAALYEIIAVATDLTEMSVAHLMAQPKIMEAIVQRVQNIGRIWDHHPDWHGRNWYVQVLLAVASLSRVVEWWEAEKQFWNFDDDEEEQDEPLMFVTKPPEEEETTTTVIGSVPQSLPLPPSVPLFPSPVYADADVDGFKLNPEDDQKNLPPTPPTVTRRPFARETHDMTPSKLSLPVKPIASPSPSKIIQAAESARVLATERLRLQAETAQNQNIVMELSLDGEHFIWINHAWSVVVGTEPEDLPGTRISALLAPSDNTIFKEATQRLQEDDSHTIEVRFKLQIVPSMEHNPSAGTLYQLMEGKGMLIIDREDGQPSHTMWVIKPIAPARFEHGAEAPSLIIPENDLAPEPASSTYSSFADRFGFNNGNESFATAAPLPFTQPISKKPILCRICECEIPQWYFEKHSETCVETHRLEAEVVECNESIAELRNTIRDLLVAMERVGSSSSASSSTVPEYRGMQIFIPSSLPIVSSPLQLFRANKMQRLGVKKMQRRLLEQIDEILQVALEISMPSLKEEEANEPIERQRLLTPGSEKKVTQIRQWAKPSSEDAALSQLIVDAERIMRQKVDNVVRMQNTIRYSEKIWCEWQERVEGVLVTVEESEGSGSSGESDGESGSGSNSTPGEEEKRNQLKEDDKSCETSECGGTARPSQEPTPAASQALILPPIASATAVVAGTPTSTTGRTPATIRQPQFQATRSATPSSVSSPLARVQPIVAPPSPEEPVPPMLFDGSPAPASASSILQIPSSSPSPPPPAPQPQSLPHLMMKSHMSTSNLLEPRLVITPPASPQVSASLRGRDRDGSSNGSGSGISVSLSREGSRKRMHRRHSTANSLTSLSLASATSSGGGSGGPLSPRQISTQPFSRSTPTSIKDFDIIKPISKGAFGSVFLAKKKATGDYYAIKVLKKADMIAKNQITNVKAERMILMKQAESPFVAKLYFTFQSKENLYLVMEYLNGGDCAALIKSLGSLPEEWTKSYIAEVVLGLDYLHQRGIVHRDLKPDNLLIDSHGHLKLTDFGLSRIGLLGRQTRDGAVGMLGSGVSGGGSGPPSVSMLARRNSRSRPPSIDSGSLSSPLIFTNPNDSYFNQQRGGTGGNSVSRHGVSVGNPYSSSSVVDEYGVSDSSASGMESLSSSLRRRQSGRLSESPLQSFATELTTDLRSHSNGGGSGTPPGEQKFVGTPDYLAPETILGLRGDDAAVDWWALGVITYEFLYGMPPFHADAPEKVFENILSGHVEWHEDWVDFSKEALEFTKLLLTLDPNERLGSGGAEEVEAHPFFAGIDWDKVTTSEAAFIPQVTDPESTDYFDPRGAIPQLFHDEELVSLVNQASQESVGPSTSSIISSPAIPVPISSRENSSSGGSNDFGSFNFKNLPVLKQANDDLIRRLKTSQMETLTEPGSHRHNRKRSLSQRMKKPPSVVTNVEPGKAPAGPPSPATSTSSIASSPSRTTLPPPIPVGGVGHIRKPSEYGAVERFKWNHLEGERRVPSRLRTASVSSAGDGSGSETWQSAGHGSQHESNTPPSSIHSIDLRKGPDPTDRVVTCLLAEDNPITAKIIETLLIRLGCRVVVVADGSEAVSVAMDIKFDCILMDLQMPVLDGESAARYIKSTNGKNANTPIVAVSAYSGTDPNETSNVFTTSLSKPLQKTDLIAVMRQLGFKTSTLHHAHPKVTAGATVLSS